MKCCYSNLGLSFTFTDLNPCNDVKCKFYAKCQAFGPFDARCICDENCPKYEEQVCSKEHITFQNQKFVELGICKSGRNIELLKNGSCERKNSISVLRAIANKVVCLSVYLRACVRACVRACLSLCLSVCLSVCRLVGWLVGWYVYLLACVRACVRACVHAYLPACLRGCQLVGTMSVCLLAGLSLFFSVSLSLCLSVSVSVSVSVCFTVCLRLSTSLFVCLCLSVCLSLCLPVSLF